MDLLVAITYVLVTGSVLPTSGKLVVDTEAEQEPLELSLLQLPTAGRRLHSETSLVGASAIFANRILERGSIIGSEAGVGRVITNSPTNLLNAIASAADGITEVARAGNSAINILHKVGSFAKDSPLGGNSKQYINSLLLLMFVVVCIAVFVIFLIERCFPQIYDMLHYGGPPKGRPALWVLMLLILSYGLLIPGLSDVLFSFKVALRAMGVEVIITNVDGVHAPISESTFSVIALLGKTGSAIGACLVAFYAIVVPALKLIFLFLGEYFRNSANPNHASRARWFIVCVQTASKWACPDMFAYILLLCLLRHLPDHCEFIDAPGQLDVGFTCFLGFCVFSTLSSLAIELPNEAICNVTAKSTALRLLGQRGILPLTMIMMALFVVLLVYGLTMPCMILTINENALVKPQGPLPLSMAPLLKSFHISEMVNAEVDIWSCIQSLSGWVQTMDDGNCIVAVVMLTVFAIFFPCADMFMLVVASWHLSYKQPDTENTMWTHNAMSAAMVLGKIAMLDVLIMGVLVVCFAAGAYASMGVSFGMSLGIIVLIAAEAVHYITYWIVAGAVAADNADRQAGNVLKHS